MRIQNDAENTVDGRLSKNDASRKWKQKGRVYLKLKETADNYRISYDERTLV